MSTVYAPIATRLHEPPARTAEVRSHMHALLFILAFVSVTLYIAGSDLRSDNDIWWHVRAGQDMLATHAVPTLDSYSSYAGGRPWIDYSWLFDLCAAALFPSIGIAGMQMAGSLMLVVSMVAAAGLLLAPMRFWHAGLLAVAAYVALAPMHTPRPWQITMLFFIFELYVIGRAQTGDRPGVLFVLMPLFALWANLHVQFVYGLAVLALFAGLQIARLRRRGAIHLVAFTACLAATLVNPYGPKVYEAVWQHASSTAPLFLIQEMAAMQFRSLPNWLALAFLAASVYTLGRVRSENRFHYLLLALATVAAFRSARDVWFLVLSALFVIAECARSAAINQERRVFRWLCPATVLCAGLALPFLGPNSRSIEAELDRTFPVEAARYVADHRLPGPLYNTYDWGGYLIWRLPSYAVSIDGRANLYSDYLTQALGSVSRAQGWEHDVALLRAKLVLLPAQCALTSVLELDRRFRIVHRDRVAVVFVRL